MLRLLALLLMLIPAVARPQAYPPLSAPGLEFVMQLRVAVDAAYTVGDTPRGRRVVVPIAGGTFEGPALRGTILRGGADYQMVGPDGRRTELEAIYSIETDDGVCIHVRNVGLVCERLDAQGRPTTYFKAAPRFEAPADSRYAWLNDALYVCAPEFTPDFEGVVLNVWAVM